MSAELTSDPEEDRQPALTVGLVSDWALRHRSPLVTDPAPAAARRLRSTEPRDE